VTHDGRAGFHVVQCIVFNFTHGTQRVHTNVRRCLYGEMKVRDAILKGTTEAEQLELIYRLFGTPSGKRI
jgi:hypothetical protein